MTDAERDAERGPVADAEFQSYNKPCEGGPLDGMEFPSRFPDGFLVVNRPAGEMVAYLPSEDESTWVLFDPHLRPLQAKHPEGGRILGHTRRGHARGDRLDVVAYDPDRMGPW